MFGFLTGWVRMGQDSRGEGDFLPESLTVTKMPGEKKC